LVSELNIPYCRIKILGRPVFFMNHEMEAGHQHKNDAATKFQPFVLITALSTTSPTEQIQINLPFVLPRVEWLIHVA
jgi:hypothetical protein